MAEKSEGGLKDVVNYLHLWYETYHKIILYMGTMAVSILFFSATFLIKEILVGPLTTRVDASDLLFLKKSFVLFGVSLLFVFINLLTTYGWFVTAVERAISHSGVDLGVLGEQFTYRRWMGGMWIWGRMSLISGWLAGLSLFIGVIFYVIAVWGIMSTLLNPSIPGGTLNVPVVAP